VRFPLTRIAAAYDSGDGVHPSDAGARALAAAIDPAIFLRGRRVPGE
jgi:lysophospholipase L1-like esterase